MTEPHSSTAECIPDNSVQLPLTALDEIAQCWLNTQCDMITGTLRGMVLKTSDDGDDVQLLASWPHTINKVSKRYIEAFRKALHEQSVVIVARNDSDQTHGNSATINCVIAAPLLDNKASGPIAVFELPDSVRHQQHAVEQILQWGAAWFSLLRSNYRPTTSRSRLDTIVRLLASSLEYPEFNASALTTVSEIATHLECTQVSLGLRQGSTVMVCAISNSARVDTRFNLTRAIGAAMNEAVDQGATISWPCRTEGLPYIALAHKTLAEKRGGTLVLSTPLYDGVNAVGALTIERDAENVINQDCIEICETLGMLLGPVFALKHEKEQSLVFKTRKSLRVVISRLFGTRHVAMKLSALALLCTALFLSFATTDYRINAQARVEGSVMRAITAPGDGYIASAARRAGDLVKAGDILANLNDRELRLELIKLNSQQEQLNKEYRTALTTHDRSAAAIIASRKQQTDAQQALIEGQLLRTTLKAPLAGIVVSGDLSQSIGSPVANGQVLFEIAPLNDYRVILDVDERDIGSIKQTQHGTLKLAGLPGISHPFSIDKIVPLSTPHEGRNVFEVQAGLDDPSDAIRPGMEGIGKIYVGQRKLIWVWTHQLIDWIRLTLWTWTS